MCGPLVSAVMMWSLDHGFPQSAGHPCVLYRLRRDDALCFNANALGHIKPDLPMSSLTATVDGKSLLVLMALLRSWCVRKVDFGVDRGVFEGGFDVRSALDGSF